MGWPSPPHDDGDDDNSDYDTDINVTIMVIQTQNNTLNLFKVSRNGVALSSTVKAISLSGCSRLTDRGLALVARRCHLLQV